MPTPNHLFHDLAKPVKGTDWWTVPVAFRSTVGYYLLKKSNALADLTGYTISDFLFDTETEAHEHASAYYKFHGKDYPYHTEWNNAIGVANAVAYVNSKVTSQVMEF